MYHRLFTFPNRSGFAKPWHNSENMSLDVYLTREKWVSYDNGQTHTVESEEVYSANITHNLNKMADAAGIYNCLWRPDECYQSEDGNVYAKDLIVPIREGLEKLERSPVIYRAFNAPNGWGLYEHFVPWIERYLHACIEYPESIVTVSR